MVWRNKFLGILIVLEQNRVEHNLIFKLEVKAPRLQIHFTK